MLRIIEEKMVDVVNVKENSWEDEKAMYQTKETTFINDKNEECVLSEARVCYKQNILDIMLSRIRYVEAHYIGERQIYGEAGIIKNNQKIIKYKASF